MENFKGKKILVFGLGLNQGGVGVAKFFRNAGAKVRVTDLKLETDLKLSLESLKEFSDIEYSLGGHQETDFDWADIIIKNPSVKPSNKFLNYAKSQEKQIETDVSIFLDFVSPKQIIGVTGTKGKSTTASLIYEVLKHSSKKIILAGNIGTSILDIIPEISDETLIVLEISSFQLEGFDAKKVSPHISVITNIFPDHLNYYQNFEEYTNAKKIIAKYQNKDDFLIIKKGDTTVDNPEFLDGIKSWIIYFDQNNLPENFSPKLIGGYNLQNFAAALAVSKILGISERQALNSLANFGGIHFRLEKIYDKNGLKIYNDSAATNPDATIEALKTLPGCILICGGMNKNLEYEELKKALHKYPKDIYFLAGDVSEELQKDFPDKKIYDNLEELLGDIKKAAQKDDIILFSPGATSFNLFQNEFDRGEKFNQAVEKAFGKRYNK